MHIDLNPIRTLVKAGYCPDSLAEAIKGFEVEVVQSHFGLGNTIKYATFQSGEGIKSYFLMVSQQKERRTSHGGYNVLLTVTSRSDTRNKDISDKFENETKIKFDIDPPEDFKKNTFVMDGAFEICEKNPDQAMYVLSKL